MSQAYAKKHFVDARTTYEAKMCNAVPATILGFSISIFLLLFANEATLAFLNGDKDKITLTLYIFASCIPAVFGVLRTIFIWITETAHYLKN